MKIILYDEKEDYIYNILTKLNLCAIDSNIEVKYAEDHRYYHTYDHIIDILKQIDDAHINNRFHKDDIEKLQLAALFHDVIYDPRSKTNEEDSVKFMYDHIGKVYSPDVLEEVSSIILATKAHSNYKTPLEEAFCRFDLSSFEQSFEKVLLDEKQIRKEYEWVDWAFYQSSRIEILEKFKKNWLLSGTGQQNVEFEIEYLKFHVPNIAIYPGSFNPFHTGHLNILEKAEKIFDKVIVAFGSNPEKKSRYPFTIPTIFKYKQVETYAGLLTDYIKTKKYPVTVIRGLRNTTDFAAEQNQYRWLQELSDNNIKVVSIFCDKEFEHISSSAIRNVKQYGEKIYNKHLVL